MSYERTGFIDEEEMNKNFLIKLESVHNNEELDRMSEYHNYSQQYFIDTINANPYYEFPQLSEEYDYHTNCISEIWNKRKIYKRS